MSRRFVSSFVLALLAVVAGPAAADNNKDKVTTWERKAGDISLKYEVGKDTA